MDTAFRVSDLLAGRHQHRRVEFSVALGLVMPQVETAPEGRASGSLTARQGIVMFEGSAVVGARMTCVRCLTSWEEELEAEVAAYFATRPSEDQYPMTPDGVIDLEPPVVDAVGGSLPLLPLCREDCAGLCPVCGTDLNVERCGGHESDEDSPFGALRQLITD